MSQRKRPSENGEILSKNKYLSAMNRPVACHNPVSRNFLIRHAEISAPMDFEPINLYKRVYIQKLRNPLAGSQFTAFMLYLYFILASSGE
jgi:hypothetical protein